MNRLLDAVQEVFAEALGAGGTSFDRLYVNVNGESGYFDRALAVYGREGQPCPRCGTPVRRDPFMNRSAYSCPVCQPRPRNGRGVTASAVPLATGCSRLSRFQRVTHDVRGGKGG